MTVQTLRLFVSLPPFAVEERLQFERVVAEVNTRMHGRARILWISQVAGEQPGSRGLGRPDGGIGACDAIIAMLRPRLASDPADISVAVHDAQSGGGTARILSAVDRRGAGVPIPDMFIFRYADAATRVEGSRDWVQGKALFENWFKKRNGDYLGFEDFGDADEFASSLMNQLYFWLEWRGLSTPRSEQAATVELEIETPRGPVPSPEPTKIAPRQVAAADIGGEFLAPDEVPAVAARPLPDAEEPATALERAPEAAHPARVEFVAQPAPVGGGDDAAGTIEYVEAETASVPESRAAEDATRTEAETVVEAPPVAEASAVAEKAAPSPEVLPVAEAPEAEDITVESVQEGEVPLAEAVGISTDVEPVVASTSAETVVPTLQAEAIAAPPVEATVTEEPVHAHALETLPAENAEVAAVAVQPTEVGQAVEEKQTAISPKEIVTIAASVVEPATPPAVPEAAEASASVPPSTDRRLAEIDTPAVRAAVAELFDLKAPLVEPAPVRAEEARPATAPLQAAAKPAPAEDAITTPEVYPTEIAPAAYHPIAETTAIGVEPETQELKAPVQAAFGDTINKAGPDASADLPTATGDGKAAEETPIAKPAMQPVAGAQAVNERTSRIAGIQPYVQAGQEIPTPANDRRAGLRAAGYGAAVALLVAAAVAAWFWRGAAQERDSAHQNLTRAADEAGDLVFALSQKFRSDAGASDVDSKAILDQAQKLHSLLLQATPADPHQRQTQANALKSSAEESFRKGDLAGALKAAMGAQQLFQVLSTAEPGQVEWRRQLAATNKRVGDAFIALKRFGDGIAAYGEAIALAKGFGAQSPDNVEWRRLQVETNLALGNALTLQGRLEDALTAYREGVGIANALSVSDPANSEWQEDIAASDVKIGAVFVAQGHLDEALAAYRDSLSIRKAVSLQNLGSGQRQRDLAFSMQKVGDVLVVLGHLDDGLAAYKDGLGVRLALVMKDPANAEWRRELYETSDAVGDVLAAQNHLDEALAAYREGFAVASSTVQKNPADAEWQRILTLCDNKIGDVLMARGQADDALAAYREGLGVVKALAAKAPNDADWQSLTATGNERMGDVFAAEGHRESALSAYRDALGIVQGLATKEPANDGWQRAISETDLRIGAVLFDQGHVDDAIESHRASLAIVKSMALKDPANVRWQRDLLMDNVKIGQLLVSKGSRDDALTTYREGLTIAKNLSTKEPDNPEWQSSRAMIDSNIGALLIGQGKRDDALANYHDGLSVAKSLAARDSQNVEWQTSLIVALYNLAEVGEDPTSNFDQALSVLKRLDAAGVLPPEKKGLIAKIEGKLVAPGKHASAVD